MPQLEKTAEHLHAAGVVNVFVTRGSEGVFYSTAEEQGSMAPGAEETVVQNTTGAGDTFLAVLAYAHLENWDLRRSLHFALTRAREIARKNGVRYAYVGNVRDIEGSTTWCHECGAALIRRDGYRILDWRLTDNGRCLDCESPCAGLFEAKPGNWGARHELIRLSDWAELPVRRGSLSMP